MFFDRETKEYSARFSGDWGIGGKEIPQEEIEEFRNLEKTKGVGCGDYLLNSKMPSSTMDYSAYFGKSPVAVPNFDFDEVKKVFLYNTGEILHCYYSKKEKWIVTVGEDGVYIRGGNTPLRHYFEARFLLWQNKGEVHPDWLQGDWREIQENLKRIGVPPLWE